jgi:hypothetical protein
MSTHHNPRSGDWDKHYGTPKGIEWEKPEVAESYRAVFGSKREGKPITPAGGEVTGAGKVSAASGEKKLATTGASTGAGPAATEKEKFMQRIGDSGKSLDQLLDLVKAKVSKLKVLYADSSGGHTERCEECRYFKSPDSCSEVAGSISPKGWCRLWEQKEKTDVEKGWLPGSSPPKPTNTSQKRALKQDAAHALVNHHLYKIQGNDTESKTWGDHAEKLSKLAGAGPTKKMMQGHVETHAAELKDARKKNFMVRSAEESHQAASQASLHPLVGSKHDVAEKALPTPPVHGITSPKEADAWAGYHKEAAEHHSGQEGIGHQAAAQKHQFRISSLKESRDHPNLAPGKGRSKVAEGMSKRAVAASQRAEKEPNKTPWTQKSMPLRSDTVGPRRLKPAKI